MIDLTKLETLARAATPGMRREGSVEKYHVFVESAESIGPERVLLRMNEHYANYANDAAFIAAVGPEVVLEIIDLLRGMDPSDLHLAERCTCACRRVRHRGHGGECLGCAGRSEDPSRPQFVINCHKFKEKR